MSVKLEKVLNTKISGKGILKAIDDMGFHLQDVKEGTIDTISLDDISDLLLDKEVTITFANKECDSE